MHERSFQNGGYASIFQGDLLTGNFDTSKVIDNVEVQNSGELLTIHAAARRAGVSRASVLSWIRNGFIQAQTSPQGWMVRAGDIEDARNGADEARLGRVADIEVVEDTDTLIADAAQTSEHSKSLVAHRRQVQQPDQLGDAFLAPLAEFVRDQADVVQEQAETIGWLQSELRRARQQLEVYEVSAPAEEAQEADNPEPEASDETGQDDWDFDPFTDLPPKQSDSEPNEADDVGSAITDTDPFSDEPDDVKLMIEETERKIIDLWDEQNQLQRRHERSQEDDGPGASWVRRLVTSWRKQEAAD